MTIPPSAPPTGSSASAQHIEGAAVLTQALVLLGAPGVGPIIAALGHGPADFAQLCDRVPGTDAKTVALRLPELAAAGLVIRAAAQDASHQTLYTLDTHGRALLIPLASLWVWAEEHLSLNGSRPHRDAADDGDRRDRPAAPWAEGTRTVAAGRHAQDSGHAEHGVQR
ncbi:winged helix-turn-helix transcriptional regulator [Streptomyces sp. NPDC003483]